MATVHDEIRSYVESFTAELTALVREAAFEAVRGSLGGAAPTPAARTRTPVAGARRAAEPKPAAKPVTRPARRAAAEERPKGEKRDPRLLAALVERLWAYIQANPGQRIEQINRALGMPTKDLALPIKKLLAANRITSRGEKRATTYAGR
jgi:hypothetical protein